MPPSLRQTSYSKRMCRRFGSLDVIPVSFITIGVSLRGKLMWGRCWWRFSAGHSGTFPLSYFSSMDDPGGRAVRLWHSVRLRSFRPMEYPPNNWTTTQASIRLHERQWVRSGWQRGGCTGCCAENLRPVEGTPHVVDPRNSPVEVRVPGR